MSFARRWGSSGMGKGVGSDARAKVGLNASKYRAQRTEYNGISYASKAEAARAMELDLLLRAGEIVEWIGQPTVRLGIPENVYRPDFLVIGKYSVHYRRQIHCASWYEDIKGMETPKFRRDKKLWKVYGRLPLHIIKGGKVVEVITPERGTPNGEKAT